MSRRRRWLHPPLRLQLTLAFSLAMALLLVALGLFIEARVHDGLDASLNQGLHSQANDVSALVKQADSGLAEAGGRALPDRGGGFAQVLLPGGSVLDQTPGLVREPLLTRAQVALARKQPILITTRVAGVSGPVRLLAMPVRAQGTTVVVIAGVSLHGRTVALDDLRTVMLLGGPVALLLASLLGYGISALALRSVEAMRRRASRLSVADPSGRLPVPVADDELRRLAVTLNEMLDRNEAAFARERRFVADASHELRAPLAVLKAELEVALAGEGGRRELHAALASANAEADRVAHLARDLLTLAQMNDGELPIEPDELDVAELIEHVGERFAPRARAEGRTLAASVPDGLMVFADALRTEQALSSLLDNALRHGAGAVTLSAERNRRGAIDVHVTDEGAGFPDGFLEVAFERFSRPDAGRSSEGTGLGLSIVRGIARAHGGDAHVRNLAGGGADAWISLPELGARAVSRALVDAAAAR